MLSWIFGSLWNDSPAHQCDGSAVSDETRDKERKAGVQHRMQEAIDSYDLDYCGLPVESTLGEVCGPAWEKPRGSVAIVGAGHRLQYAVSFYGSRFYVTTDEDRASRKRGPSPGDTAESAPMVGSGHRLGEAVSSYGSKFYVTNKDGGESRKRKVKLCTKKVIFEVDGYNVFVTNKGPRKLKMERDGQHISVKIGEKRAVATLMEGVRVEEIFPKKAKY